MLCSGIEPEILRNPLRRINQSELKRVKPKARGAKLTPGSTYPLGL